MLIIDNLYFSLSTQDMGKTHRHEKKVKCYLFFNEKFLSHFCHLCDLFLPLFTTKLFAPPTHNSSICSNKMLALKCQMSNLFT